MTGVTNWGQIPEGAGLEASADFDSYHIEGMARHALQHGKPAYFNVPLISRIEGDLWVGGCRDGVSLPEQFKYVVSLFMWEKYTLPKGCSRVEVEMYDQAEMPDAGLVVGLGELVAYLAGLGPTLVHCQAGLNRSNLIAAMALRTQGKTSQEAIALLRKKRSPLVLCNETFEQWLLDLDA